MDTKESLQAQLEAQRASSRSGPRTPTHVWDALYRDLRAEVHHARKAARDEQQPEPGSPQEG